jgi:hypothetical protein
MSGGGGGGAAGAGITTGGISVDALQAQQFMLQMQQMQAEAMRQQAMQMQAASQQAAAQRAQQCARRMDTEAGSTPRVATIRDTGDRFAAQRDRARVRQEALATRIADREAQLQRRRDRAAAGR